MAISYWKSFELPVTILGLLILMDLGRVIGQ